MEQTNEPGRQLGVRARTTDGEHGAERGNYHAGPEQRAVLALEDVAVVRRVNGITLLRDARLIGACGRIAELVSPTRSTVTPTTAVATPATPSAMPDQNIAPRCSPEDAVGFSCANAGVAASASTSTIETLLMTAPPRRARLPPTASNLLRRGWRVSYSNEFTQQVKFLQSVQRGIGQNAPVLKSLRERKEWKFFAVLPKAAGRSRSPGGRCSCCAACCRRCSPSRWACSSAPCSAATASPAPLTLRRRRVRPAADAHADSPGGRRQPRRSHGRVALRSADRRVRAPARHGPSRGSEADERPHRRARLRPRHDRPAAVDLHGLHRRRPGRDRSAASRARSCCSRYAWWAPLVLGGAWLATHWLLRESAVWRDRNTEEVRAAQRDADYAYRLAVDPPASKELRLFGLGGLDDRPLRRAPHAAARAAVRGDAAARAAACMWSLLLVVVANVVVFWSLANAAAGGRLESRRGRRVRPERGRACR